MQQTCTRADGAMRWPAVAKLAHAALAVLLSACGGGTGEPAVKPSLSLLASPTEVFAATLADASLQVANPGNSTLQGLRLQLQSDTGLAVHQLRCESVGTATCGEFDGRQILLPELPAGASLVLKMRMASAAGQGGELSNHWTLVGAPGGDVSLVQTLRSRKVDVSLQLAEPEIQAGGDAGDQHLYALTLGNSGPDEARDVELQLLASADLSLLGVDCVASGGAVCAASWTDRSRIERLPAGAQLRLSLRYRRAPAVAERGGTGRHGVSLYAQVLAGGDTQIANNRAEHSIAAEVAYLDERFTAVSGRGRAFDVIWNGWGPWNKSWRAIGEGLDLIASTPVDATGVTFLSSSYPLADKAPLWPFADHFKGLMVGAYELGQGPEFFIGARQFHSRWADLVGQRFVVLASESTLGGEPVDARAMRAELVADGLLLCTDATQLDAQGICPASLLERFAAYPQLDAFRLVSMRHELSLRLASTAQGTVLLATGRDVTAGRTRLWMGLPATSGLPAVPAPTMFFGYGSGAVTDIAALAGERAPMSATMLGLEQDGSAIAMSSSFVGIPLAYKRYFAEQLGFPNEASGRLVPQSAPGLFGGTLSIKTSSYGTTASTLVTQGAVYAISSSQLFAMLGAKGSPIMGRWVIVLGSPS